MNDYTSFATESQFHGDEHFPYGLARSGEFTQEQAELLTNHGYAYKAIADGNRAPVTQEEQRFLEVCRGERRAQSAHEKVWQRFLDKTNPRKTVASPLGPSSTSRARDFSAALAEVNVD